MRSIRRVLPCLWLAVVLLAILVMASAVLGWLGGLVAWLIVLGALAVYLWLTGLQMRHSYATACHPASSLACAMNFTGRYGITAIIVSIFLQLSPNCFNLLFKRSWSVFSINC